MLENAECEATGHLSRDPGTQILPRGGLLLTKGLSCRLDLGLPRLRVSSRGSVGDEGRMTIC